jgi:phosphatidylglycerophosphate synthase
MKRPKITIAEVKASFNSNVPGSLLYLRLWRPIAYVMTPFFYNTGFSANNVTYLRIVLAFMGLGLFTVLDIEFINIAIFIIAWLCIVMDCVDGNVARLTDTASYWGKFIDGLADFTFIQLGPLVAGIGLSLHYGRDDMLILGSLITTSTLISQMVRARLSFMREWMISETGALSKETVALKAKSGRTQKYTSMIYNNGTSLAPLGLLIGGMEGFCGYLYALACVQLLPELVWLSSTLNEASRILRRHRKSRHARLKSDAANTSP